jgi:hypothetical protein
MRSENDALLRASAATGFAAARSEVRVAAHTAGAADRSPAARSASAAVSATMGRPV